MGSYPYHALRQAKETRLLTIEPAEFASTIDCSLSHVSLSDRPSYEALSYVWNSTNPNTPPALDTRVKVALYGTNREAIGEQPFRELQNDPDTASLYYQAGGTHHPQAVICDSMKLLVGGELFAALKRLRYGDRSRVLWVDALCINQSDLEERKRHVQLMGQIYAHASKVVIWLGEGIPANVQAFMALEDGVNTLLDLRKHESDPVMLKVKFMSDPKMRSHHWDALGDLLRNAWFERVWVIQEIANASTAEIQIGEALWPWDYFSFFVHAFRVHDVDVVLQGRGIVTAIAAIGLMRSLGCEENVRPPLLEILHLSRHFKSTLPQDKFYGVLGLASDVSDNFVRVDYSLDASTIYTEFAMSHMRKRGVLDVLYCCTKSKGHSVLNLPSWVPDWTQPCHHRPFLFIYYKCRAAADSEIKLCFKSKNRSLFVLGKLVDSIETVEQLRRIPREGYGDTTQRGFVSVDDPNLRESSREIWRSYHNDFVNDNTEASRRWIDNAVEIAFPNKVCSTEFYENLWRTFVCNQTQDGTTPPDSWGQHFSDFLIAIKQPDKAHPDTWKREAQDPYDLREPFGDADSFQRRRSMVTEFNTTFGTWCFNRRFYRTVAGRFGWAPDCVEAGDEVCVLYGGPVPLLLRPDGAGHHEVIGDCYLHGFMDGEAMDAKFEEREIHLI